MDKKCGIVKYRKVKQVLFWGKGLLGGGRALGKDEEWEYGGCILYTYMKIE
jgi:hypothetical protein